jgi:very-short-patch-repair endonuclease
MVMVCEDRVVKINPKTGLVTRGFYMDAALKYYVDHQLIPAVNKNWDAVCLISGIEGCCAEDTKIRTPDGYKSLKELGPCETDIKSWDFEKQEMVDTRAKIIDTGEKEVFEIETSRGKKIVVTADHKMFVKRNHKIIEVAIKNLLSTDKLVIAKFKWTPEWDARLKEDYPKLCWRGFLEKYKNAMTINEMQHRTYELDIKVDPESHKIVAGQASSRWQKGVPKKHRFLTAEETSEARKLWLEKISVSEICKKYGVPSYRVNQALRKIGIDTRFYGKLRKDWTNIEKSEYIKDYPELTTQELIDKYKLSRKELWLYARKFGIRHTRDFNWFRTHHKRNETDIERKMKELLIANNIPFESDRLKTKISDGLESKYPDFISGKLAIECDGDCWHTMKMKYVYRDHDRDIFINKCGYSIIHFNYDIIMKHPEMVIKCIQNKLKQLQN